MENKVLSKEVLDSISLEREVSAHGYPCGELTVAKYQNRKVIRTVLKSTTELMELYFDDSSNYSIMQWKKANTEDENLSIKEISKKISELDWFLIFLDCYDDGEVTIYFSNHYGNILDNKEFRLIGENVNELLNKATSKVNENGEDFELYNGYEVHISFGFWSSYENYIRDYYDLKDFIGTEYSSKEYLDNVIKANIPFDTLVKEMINKKLGVIDPYKKTITFNRDDIGWEIKKSKVLENYIKNNLIDNIKNIKSKEDKLKTLVLLKEAVLKGNL